VKKVAVLFVCLGNICRSPTAHGLFRQLVAEHNLSHCIEIESAGTSGWHIDEPPDPRSVSAAKSRGCDISDLRGRKFEAVDFNHYDYILAMDTANLDHLIELCPAGYSGEVKLFLDYSSQAKYREVPDPYHGGTKGFELVLDLIEDGCNGLLNTIKKEK
jgi:protein tyrosine phosphatase